MGRRETPRSHRKAISKRLRSLLDGTGPGGARTQEEFAEQTEISKRTLQGWLRGGANAKAPDLPLLIQLCEETGVSPTWLLFGEGPELRGTSIPRQDLFADLRRSVVVELRAASGDALTILEGFVSPPEVLFREVVSDQVNRLAIFHRAVSADLYARGKPTLRKPQRLKKTRLQ